MAEPLTTNLQPKPKPINKGSFNLTLQSALSFVDENPVLYYRHSLRQFDILGAN
jgi:hypothetical protein